MKECNVSPKISIITPNFNGAAYLEETILSVINQNYTNIEYVLIDGNSNDPSIDIIKKYEKSLAYWVSESDKGQSSAINKGISVATGDVIAWLNSDDLYMPDTLSHVLNNLDISKAEICFGNCIHFKQEAQAVKAWGSDVIHHAQHGHLENYDYIIQPSSFWTRRAWEIVGSLREDLHYAFDWEWFLRAKAVGVTFRSTPQCLSMYRIHDQHKSGNGGKKRQDEIATIYSQYSDRYAKLYALIRNGDFSTSSLHHRIVRKILYYSGKSYSDIDILKYINSSKYESYTSEEIHGCTMML